jgi:hypothetical protein
MAKLLSGTRIYGTATVDTTLFVDGTDDASSATTGAVQVVGGVGIGGTLYVEGTTVFAGDLAVNGGNLTTTATTFNLINTTATTVNFAGEATDIQIGAATGTTEINNNLNLVGNLDIDGGNLTVSTATFNIANTNATTVNFAGEATDIQIGAAIGITNINNNLDVDGDVNIDGGDLTTNQSTFNLANTNATTVNFAGEATDIQIGAAIGITNINNNLDVDGDVNIDGGDLTTNQSTFNLVNTTATTGNLFGAGTAITIGATTGTTTIRNANTVVTGDLAVNGGDITSSAVTVNILPDTSTTVNAFGAASTLNLGATEGTTIVRNNFEVDLNTVLNGTLTVDLDTIVTGDLAVNGGDLTTSSSTFNLVNTNATTVNFAGAATTIEIGAATGTTNVNNNLDVDGDVNIDGGDLTTNQSTFNLANTTATTVNFAGAATDIQIGSSSGTTNINHDLDVDGDVNIDGGDLTTNQSTFNIANTTATTGNLFGAGTAITIGATTGTTTIRNANTVVTGDLAVNGGDITTTATGTATLFNTNATTVNFAGAATDIQIGSSSGTTNINHDLDVDGDVNIDGGDLTTTATTFNLINDTATTVNFAGAATDIQIGSSSGTTNINHDLDVDGDVNIDGGDLTVSTATFNLANTTATTVNFAGAATDIQIGSSSGTTNINHDLDVDGDVNIDGGDITTNVTGTFNLLNTTVTNVNAFGDAETIAIGKDGSTITTLQGKLTLVGTSATTHLTTSGSLYIDGVASNNIVQASSFARTAGLGMWSTGTEARLYSTSSFEFRTDVTLQDQDVPTGGTNVLTLSTAGVLTLTNDIVGTATQNVFNTVSTTINAFGVANSVNVGVSATAASTLTYGPAITGNTFKLAGTSSGTINYTTDVTSGTVNAWPSVTGTINIGESGTVNLGNSTAASTAIVVGGAITGNSLKIASTSSGTVILNSDVTTGTVDLFNNITTGTVNIASSGSSTINLGNATSTVNVGELTLVTDLEVQYGGTGVSTFTTNGILFGNAADPILVTTESNPGSNAITSFGILTTDINNVPVWTDVIDGGSY